MSSKRPSIHSALPFHDFNRKGSFSYEIYQEEIKAIQKVGISRLRKLAAKSDENGTYLLGFALLFGIDVKQDVEASLLLLCNKVLENNANALYFRAIFILRGLDRNSTILTNSSVCDAEKLLEKAIQLNGHLRSKLCYANIIQMELRRLQKSNFIARRIGLKKLGPERIYKAAEYSLDCVNARVPAAFAALAEHYENGWAVEKSAGRARQLEEEGALLGSQDCMYSLAIRLESMQGFSAETALAYERAAKVGHAQSCHILGLSILDEKNPIYRSGTQDKGSGREMAGYIHRAAQQGYPPSIGLLSDMYLSGVGVSASAEDAYLWVVKAVKIGSRTLEEARAVLEKVDASKRTELEKRAETEATNFYSAIQAFIG